MSEQEPSFSMWRDLPSVPSFEEKQQNNDHDQAQHRHGALTGEPDPPGPPLESPAPARTFFADATLDLEEAHDMAETPEAAKPRLDLTVLPLHNRQRLQMPQLLPNNNTTSRPSTTNSTSTWPLATPAEEAALVGTSRPSNSHASRRPRQEGHVPQDENHEPHPHASVPSGANHLNDHPPSPYTMPSFRMLTHSSEAETDWRTAEPPRSPPRVPRDWSWALAFVILVPISLSWPTYLLFHGPPPADAPSPDTDTDDGYNGGEQPYHRPTQAVARMAQHPLSTASVHTLWWAAVATFILSRLLYRSYAGGEGEPGRHLAAMILTWSAPVSLAVYLALAAMIGWSCSSRAARLTVLIPLWYAVRDVYLFRRWKRRSQQAGSGSRHAFFQALTGMALDILSRSLRRASFYRVLLGILAAQLGFILWWRWALMGAMVSGSKLAWVLAGLGGKWATVTLARLLTHLASGGVMSWFHEQSLRLDQYSAAASPTHQGRESRDQELTPSHSIPEAYRTVNASVYAPVLDMEDALDDDYEADEEEFLEAPSALPHARRESTAEMRSSTVQSILTAGLTVSLGAVAQCGWWGGLAQFVWSQVRKVDAAQSAWSAARGNSFRNMPLGSSVSSGPETTWLIKLGTQAVQMARTFVRNHSDLAMCHVALYYKNYRKAARDVASLVEESGVEPILHDDITTHMCSCMGGSVCGIIVLFTGHILLQQRHSSSSVSSAAAASSKGDEITDEQVVETMLLAFVLSYTLVFTVLEPLRAAIKACYVCFAQYPETLSQAFPLIYHRLSRLSSTSNSS